MRLKKAEVWALAVTLLLLAATLGYRAGVRTRPADFTVTTAAEAAEETVPPAFVPGEVRVNINTADSETLATLPGIGPTLAGRIIDYREENGLFARSQDITKVSGIGSSTYEMLRDRICVD